MARRLGRSSSTVNRELAGERPGLRLAGGLEPFLPWLAPGTLTPGGRHAQRSLANSCRLPVEG